MNSCKVIIVLLTLAVSLFSVSLNAAPPTEEQLKAFQEHLAVLRQTLAATKLELQRVLVEVEDLKSFLKSDDTKTDTQQWKLAEAELNAERQQLANERAELDKERRNLRLKIIAPPPPAADAEDEKRPAYDIQYKIAAVPGKANQDAVFVDALTGDLIVGQSPPDIDRKNFLVRGTLQNKSTASWRYTFEIRAADRNGFIIGNWKAQTPLLSPNELHQFEVKVPVTDIGRIYQHQIGNIEADNPNNPPKKADKQKKDAQ